MQTTWHDRSAEATLQELKATPVGLSQAEAEARLRTYGANRLPEAKKRSVFVRFLLQFHNILIYVLIGSAVITAFLDHLVDTLVILAVVIANAIIGFIQEGKAEKAMDAIRQMLAPHANVLREGERRSIEGEALVPGDVVLLEAGDKVPADMRLLSTHGLSVQEAILTGESVPVEKNIKPVAADAPLGDRSGMAFSGTLVASGQGKGVVVATGGATEIGRYERRLDHASGLNSADIQKKIVDEVTELTRPLQGALDGVVAPAPDIAKVVAAVTRTVSERTISIPKIVVLPKKQVTFRFDDFDLTELKTINLRPVSDELLIENLRTGARTFLARTGTGQTELRVEDYIVRYLIERNEVDYDAHADLVYKLAGQIVARVQSYLGTEAEVENVLLSHGRHLADFVFAQMMEHYHETPLGEDDYEARITHGFTTLRPQQFAVPTGQAARNFKQAVTPLSDTKRHVFAGFTKCCYPLQRFDSDPERRFAALIDGDGTVEKWMKPGKAQFQIDYRSGDGYEPDFVVETAKKMLICEVKAETEMADPVVHAKANAAVKWCKAASQHAEKNGGKPWSYLLISDGQILGNASLAGLEARFRV